MSDAFLIPTTEQQDDAELWLIAFIVVLMLVNGNATRRLSATQRRRARNLLRTKFEDDALRLAQRLVAGQLTLAAWQAAVWQAIDDYTRQMTVAGAGQMPQPATRQAAIEELQRQRPYLEGFAAVAAGMSIAALAARTRMYGGVPYEMYWRGETENAMQPGTIVHYIARDDRATCSPCHQAQARGPYAAGTNHPVPGSVCLGRGACRCELRFEFNPDVYARLTGRRRP